MSKARQRQRNATQQAEQRYQQRLKARQDEHESNRMDSKVGVLVTVLGLCGWALVLSLFPLGQ